MEPVLDATDGYILLASFSILMVLVTTFASKGRTWRTTAGFMAAGRQVPWWLGAVSLAITWIWAPALFVSVQQAYQQGVAGLFWFTAPNILSLMIIAPLAVRIREYIPYGYTQPEWIGKRFDQKTRLMYLVPFFWYQLMAIAVQLYVGGNIYSLITGAKIEIVMTVLAASTLTYSLISGMRASIITDFLQYGLIIGATLLVIPWTISSAGGWSSVVGGLGGVTGNHGTLLDTEVAYNFGIVTSIGLISGSLADQQHWQRAFSIERSGLSRAYILSGVLFGVVPLVVGLLGFLAANATLGVKLAPGIDPSMIGVLTVAHFLPSWAIAAFVIMLLGGLCATMDSGMCAAASLFALNLTKFSLTELRIREKEADGTSFTDEDHDDSAKLDKRILARGRLAMIGITIAGGLVAVGALYIPGFSLQYLWWIFNTIAACVAAPTVLSLYWNRADSRGVFWGVLIAFTLGIPLFVYSNIYNIIWLTVASSVGIVAVTLGFCLLLPRRAAFALDSGPGGGVANV